MDPLITASLIGGGFNLLGSGLGFFGGGDSDTARGDARFMNDFAWKKALRDEEYQRHMDRWGVRIRAHDMAKAGEEIGVHPLAMMGINPAGGASVPVNFAGGYDSGYDNRWDRAASMTKDLGQDISRAVSATATREEKAMRVAQLATQLSQKRALDAEADLKIAQADDLRRNPSVPPVDPELPFNPVKKMEKGIGAVWDGIAGPRSHEFWKAVNRSGRRLLFLKER